MSLIVQKFGGTSVSDPHHIQSAARRVKEAVRQGHTPIVVVSAMAGVTDRLVAHVHQIDALADGDEYDVVVSSGEQATSGLMALALRKLGIASRSFLAWQIPIRTSGDHADARIDSIEATLLHDSIKNGEVPVIPGFQGISDQGRITTLGRGGSDMSAVALAAALKADSCEIFTDVEGIYTADPRIVESARKLATISYEEMLELASLGSKVLQTRSVQCAAKYRVPVHVRSTFSPKEGTILVSEEDMMEKPIVSGIAHSDSEAKITVIAIADRPGVAASIFRSLAEAGIIVDMIVQNISENRDNPIRHTDLTFTVSQSQMKKAMKVLESRREDIGYQDMIADADVAKISIVGVGMRAHAGVAVSMFSALAEIGVNIAVISTSEIKISVLIEKSRCVEAVAQLHQSFELA